MLIIIFASASFTALAVCAGGFVAFALLLRFLPGREDAVQLPRPALGDAAASE